ncbi:MAG: hypothetical protein RL693_1171 [Verrucomicrobiota bacterium]|jgi:hypothetical protein
MRANAIFTSLHSPGRRQISHLLVVSALAIFCLGSSSTVFADEEKQVTDAVLSLAARHEKDGFDFRADIWVRELKPELGKAVRVQFFKGNDYRVCVAVPKDSGVQIAAHVLDTEGKPVESKVETTEDGWGLVLHAKPKRTGLYVVAIRQAGGNAKPTTCAMITGYK